MEGLNGKDLFLLALLVFCGDVFLDGHSHRGSRLCGSTETKVEACVDNGLAGGVTEAADGDFVLFELREVLL